jgi:signal transduction histidine kinase
MDHSDAEASLPAVVRPRDESVGVLRVFGQSLRIRIISGVFAGLAVLFTVFGLLALQTISLSTDFALEERLGLAQTSAESIDELLDQAGRQLERTAAKLATADTAQEQELQATELHAVLGQFDQIVHLSPQGELLWVVPRQSGTATWRFAQDEAVADAMSDFTTSIVTPAHGVEGDGLIILVITPLDGQDASAGFLAAELNASHPDLGLLPLPQDGSSVRYEIVDAAGYVVAQSGVGEGDSPAEHLEIVVPLLARQQSGTALHEVDGGEDHVVAFYPLRAVPGGVVVEQTQDDALEIPRAMQRTMLIYGIGALIAASVAAWLHSGSVVRPIQRLTEDASRMASGDLDSPITIAREDEIGQLARRFDDMRVRLKTSLEESARWAGELEHRVDLRTREADERNKELHALNRIRRQLLAKTISAQEEERKRVARDLHDDSAQTLTAVLMTLKAAEDALIVDPEVAKAALTQSRSQLEIALGEIRKAIRDLRPSALDDLGLASAIRAYADERLRPRGINLSMATSGDERRARGAVATAIFRIIQEAISNVAQHSNAANVSVSLDFGPSEMLAVVEDDGGGFDPASLRQPQESGRGLGLLGMRERAELFEGEVDIESRPGSGTSVRVRMPLQ